MLENSTELHNKKYLWFLAPSGHGKTTAVKDCLRDDNHILRKRLGLEKRNIVLCEESLDRQGGKYDDLFPLLVSRHKNLEPEDAVLIDGQWPDVERDTILKLKSDLKDSDHVIIFLNCDPAEAARRCREGMGRGKEKWEPGYDVDTAQSHFKNIVENHLFRLKEKGLPVIVIDSSDREYRVGRWKDVIKALESII